MFIIAVVLFAIVLVPLRNRTCCTQCHHVAQLYTARGHVMHPNGAGIASKYVNQASVTLSCAHRVATYHDAVEVLTAFREVHTGRCISVRISVHTQS